MTRAQPPLAHISITTPARDFKFFPEAILGNGRLISKKNGFVRNMVVFAMDGHIHACTFFMVFFSKSPIS